jgi:hypothetical protein
MEHLIDNLPHRIARALLFRAQIVFPTPVPIMPKLAAALTQKT